MIIFDPDYRPTGYSFRPNLRNFWFHAVWLREKQIIVISVFICSRLLLFIKSTFFWFSNFFSDSSISNQLWHVNVRSNQAVALLWINSKGKLLKEISHTFSFKWKKLQRNYQNYSPSIFLLSIVSIIDFF